MEHSIRLQVVSSPDQDERERIESALHLAEREELLFIKRNESRDVRLFLSYFKSFLVLNILRPILDTTRIPTRDRAVQVCVCRTQPRGAQRREAAGGGALLGSGGEARTKTENRKTNPGVEGLPSGPESSRRPPPTPVPGPQGRHSPTPRQVRLAGALSPGGTSPLEDLLQHPFSFSSQNKPKEETEEALFGFYRKTPH